MSDQERMEKARKQIYTDPALYRVYREGIIAARKDDAETIQALTAELDKQKKLITAYMDERTELLGNIDAMIVDRDDAYTKREQFRKLWSEAECDGDNLRVEVDRLREAIEQARLINSDFLTDSGESIGDRIERILSATLTPQPADTPNEETLKAIADGPEPETYETADALMRDLMEDAPQPADYFEQPTQGTEPAITQRKSTKRIVGKVTPDEPKP